MTARESLFDDRSREVLEMFHRTHQGEVADAIHLLLVAHDGLLGAEEEAYRVGRLPGFHEREAFYERVYRHKTETRRGN